MKERLALATLSVMLATGCGELPESAMLDEESEDHLSRLAPVGDLNWLLYVASYDVSEMKLARLARKRSNAPLVVEFSDVKIARHQRSFDQATVLAAQSNNVLPAQVTNIGERQFQELNHLGASLFDRRFLSLQVKLHKEATNVAAQAASEAPAGEVREWASRAWTRWHRDEVWAGHLYNQVLTGHGMDRGAQYRARAVNRRVGVNAGHAPEARKLPAVGSRTIFGTPQRFGGLCRPQAALPAK